MSLRRNCETIGKSHDYEVIDIEPVNPYNVDLMITTLPRYALGRYSTVVYECRECLDTRIIDMPTEIAKSEEENNKNGKPGITKM